jgi:hypothetical protein
VDILHWDIHRKPPRIPATAVELIMALDILSTRDSKVRLPFGAEVSLLTSVYLHFALLLAVQASYAWVYAHSPYLRQAIVVPTLYRLIVWALPPCVLLMASDIHPLDYLRLRKNLLRGCAWGAAIGLGIVGISLLGTYFQRGHCRMDLAFGWNRWIGPVLLVGLSEEVLFRGYFLRKLAERTAFWKANLVQAALFLGIHVPGWILLGHFRFPGAAMSVAGVFGLALLVGYVLRRTECLWACMIVHSFNNFASFAIHS